MRPEDLQRPHPRGHFLGMALMLIVVMFLLLVLIFISFGYFLYVIEACLGVAALCAFHYVLWGRAMTQAVSGEREEEILRQRAEADDWDEASSPINRDGIRRP
jgi:hypothetical protein